MAPPTTGLPAAVQAIGALHFEGNVIPHSWYRHPDLRHDDGKVNLVAITLLSEICYWYRPKIELDETGGQVRSISKRFAADKLHWDHAQRADKFGLTKRQVQDAMAFLKGRGLITLEVREKVVLPTGATLYNQVYIEPIPEAIAKINDLSLSPGEVSRLNGIPLTFKRDTPHAITGYPPRLNEAPPTFKRELSTETKETTNKTTTATASEHVLATAPPNEMTVFAAADSDLVLRLAAAGLNQADAKRLAASHPEECCRQLEYLPFVTSFKSSRGAYLRSAIEQGFAPPQGWVEAQRIATAAADKQKKQGVVSQAQREADTKAEQERAALETEKQRLQTEQPDLWARIVAEAEAQLPPPLRGKTDHVAYAGALSGNIERLLKQRFKQNSNQKAENYSGTPHASI